MRLWMTRTLKVLAALLLVLLLIGAAWVASNGPWADALPQPVPVELLGRQGQAAPERNAFFYLQGLDAPEGADINAVGQAAMSGLGNRHDATLRWPQGEPWNCRPDREDCVRRWRAQPGQLQEFLATAAVLGARCERAARADAFDEVLMERPGSGPLAQAPFAGLPIPRFADLTYCVRWLGLRALAAPQPAEAQAWLQQADRLARLALQGSRSLIGNMVAVSAVQRNWLVAAALDPAALLPLLEPLPQAALSPRAWVPYEARFVREVIQDMGDKVRGCHRAVDAISDPVGSWLDRQLCRFGLGMLPEQSLQDSDARWLARLAVVPAEGPVACEVVQTPLWRGEGSAGAWLAWRNTVTRWMLDMPAADWAPYAARQLDLELLRQTLRAKVLGQSVPNAVLLTPEGGAQRWAACRARLLPGNAEATLRLPLL